MRLLLAKKASPDAADDHGWTPLFLASYAGHAPIVEDLVAARAGVNSATSSAQTPLIVALRRSHDAVVALLQRELDRRGHDPTALHEERALRRAAAPTQHGPSLVPAGANGGESAAGPMTSVGSAAAPRVPAPVGAAPACGIVTTSPGAAAAAVRRSPALAPTGTGTGGGAAPTVSSGPAPIIGVSAPSRQLILNENLLAAARRGDLAAVRRLYDDGAEITYTGPDGKRAADVARAAGSRRCRAYLEAKQLLASKPASDWSPREVLLFLEASLPLVLSATHVKSQVAAAGAFTGAMLVSPIFHEALQRMRLSQRERLAVQRAVAAVTHGFPSAAHAVDSVRRMLRGYERLSSARNLAARPEVQAMEAARETELEPLCSAVTADPGALPCPLPLLPVMFRSKLIAPDPPAAERAPAPTFSTALPPDAAHAPLPLPDQTFGAPVPSLVRHKWWLELPLTLQCAYANIGGLPAPAPGPAAAARPAAAGSGKPGDKASAANGGSNVTASGTMAASKGGAAASGATSPVLARATTANPGAPVSLNTGAGNGNGAGAGAGAGSKSVGLSGRSSVAASGPDGDGDGDDGFYGDDIASPSSADADAEASARNGAGGGVDGEGATMYQPPPLLRRGSSTIVTAPAPRPTGLNTNSSSNKAGGPVKTLAPAGTAAAAAATAADAGGASGASGVRSPPSPYARSASLKSVFAPVNPQQQQGNKASPAVVASGAPVSAASAAAAIAAAAAAQQGNNNQQQQPLGGGRYTSARLPRPPLAVSAAAAAAATAAARRASLELALSRAQSAPRKHVFRLRLLCDGLWALPLLATTRVISLQPCDCGHGGFTLRLNDWELLRVGPYLAYVLWTIGQLVAFNGSRLLSYIPPTLEEVEAAEAAEAAAAAEAAVAAAAAVSAGSARGLTLAPIDELAVVAVDADADADAARLLALSPTIDTTTTTSTASSALNLNGNNSAAGGGNGATATASASAGAGPAPLVPPMTGRHVLSGLVLSPTPSGTSGSDGGAGRTRACSMVGPGMAAEETTAEEDAADAARAGAGMEKARKAAEAKAKLAASPTNAAASSSASPSPSPRANASAAAVAASAAEIVGGVALKAPETADAKTDAEVKKTTEKKNAEKHAETSDSKETDSAPATATAAAPVQPSDSDSASPSATAKKTESEESTGGSSTGGETKTDVSESETADASANKSDSVTASAVAVASPVSLSRSPQSQSGSLTQPHADATGGKANPPPRSRSQLQAAESEPPSSPESFATSSPQSPPPARSLHPANGHAAHGHAGHGHAHAHGHPLPLPAALLEHEGIRAPNGASAGALAIAAAAAANAGTAASCTSPICMGRPASVLTSTSGSGGALSLSRAVTPASTPSFAPSTPATAGSVSVPVSGSDAAPPSLSLGGAACSCSSPVPPASGHSSPCALPTLAQAQAMGQQSQPPTQAQSPPSGAGCAVCSPGSGSGYGYGAATSPPGGRLRAPYPPPARPVSALPLDKTQRELDVLCSGNAGVIGDEFHRFRANEPVVESHLIDATCAALRYVLAEEVDWEGQAVECLRVLGLLGAGGAAVDTSDHKQVARFFATYEPVVPWSPLAAPNSSNSNDSNGKSGASGNNRTGSGSSNVSGARSPASGSGNSKSGGGQNAEALSPFFLRSREALYELVAETNPRLGRWRPAKHTAGLTRVRDREKTRSLWMCPRHAALAAALDEERFAPLAPGRTDARDPDDVEPNVEAKGKCTIM